MDSRRFFYGFIKRILDLIVAILGLVLFAPVMAVAALCLKLSLRGEPVLFVQQRAGLHGRPFAMVKFRSMSSQRGADGELLPDAQRLTPIGRFLRKTSIDELPELWNVLRGDMSIVGPRPLLMEYLPLYTPQQARRHEAKPGITGWAQINGRNALSWDEKFRHDVWYVDHRTIALDFKIFCLTFQRIARPEGITAPNSATSEKFTGSGA